MTSITSAAQRLAGAQDLPALLSAAYEAFELVLAGATSCQDPAGAMFAAFVQSAGRAADGRDAIGFAPSMPRPGRASGDTAPDILPAHATRMAGLCQDLATRLGRAAKSAGDPEDREACQKAAACAREINVLLTGGDP